MNRSLPVKDSIRIELVVRRVDYVLEGRVQMARRRQIRNELRSNLLDAAQHSSTQAAIKQLGDLHVLASSYLDLYRGRFDFRAGTWAAVATYTAIQVLAIVLMLAFNAGVNAGGAHAGTYSFEFWNGFGPFAGSVSANGSSFVMLLLSPAHVLLMSAAFVVGSSHRAVFARRPR